MKGRVGLSDWPIMDSLPTKWSPVHCPAAKYVRLHTLLGFADKYMDVKKNA